MGMQTVTSCWRSKFNFLKIFIQQSQVTFLPSPRSMIIFAFCKETMWNEIWDYENHFASIPAHVIKRGLVFTLTTQVLAKSGLITLWRTVFRRDGCWTSILLGVIVLQLIDTTSIWRFWTSLRHFDHFRIWMMWCSLWNVTSLGMQLSFCVTSDHNINILYTAGNWTLLKSICLLPSVLWRIWNTLTNIWPDCSSQVCIQVQAWLLVWDQLCSLFVA